MMEMTIDRYKWIEIQARVFATDEGKDWYNQGHLPRVLLNIGNASLVDLEFRSEKDALMFLLRWS